MRHVQHLNNMQDTCEGSWAVQPATHATELLKRFASVHTKLVITIRVANEGTVAQLLRTNRRPDRARVLYRAGSSNLAKRSARCIIGCCCLEAERQKINEECPSRRNQTTKPKTTKGYKKEKQVLQKINLVLKRTSQVLFLHQALPVPLEHCAPLTFTPNWLIHAKT